MAQILVHADTRVLTLFALFDSVYDRVEENGSACGDARRMMRDHCIVALRSVPQESIDTWKSFRFEHPQHMWAYVCFALTRSSDNYEIGLVSTDSIPSEIGRAAVRSLIGLQGILSEFEDAVDTESLYALLLPSWTEAINAYDRKKLEQDISSVHRLLGPRSYARAPKDIHVVPTPFDSHFSAFSLSFGRGVYTLDGPGTAHGEFNQHEFLHVFVSPIELRVTWSRIRDSFDDPISNPSIRADYGEVNTHAHECIVRAQTAALVEHPGERDSLIRSDMKSGLLLTGPFYEILKGYGSEIERSYWSLLVDMVAGY